VVFRICRGIFFLKTIYDYTSVQAIILTPLLSIQNLGVSFRNEEQTFTALHDISLTVNSGELLAVVGESGSGKSVTAMSILRLLPVKEANYDSGEILFSGDGGPSKNILTLSQNELMQLRGNEIAMIFQEPMTSLNPVMKCGKQITEVICRHQQHGKKEAREKAIRLMDKVQLPDPAGIYNRYPHELSGGQKQRVMIAMAMSCNPRLLIADEPTTALDVTVQKNVLTLIKTLQQENNMGVMFITHDLGLVSEIADSIAVMYRGRIVEYGKAKDVLLRPEHPYTRALLACRPSANSRGERLPVVSDFFNPYNISKSENSSTPLLKFDVNKTEKVGGSNLISVKNVSVHFEGNNWLRKNKTLIKAVDDVSFDIKKGETVGLVGESGCGKTTLGRTLLGLIKTSHGKIMMEDKDITSLKRKDWKALRKNIQIIFQDPYASLNPRMSIGSAIAEPMEVHHPYFSAADRREKVYDLLRKVNLKQEHYNRYPHEFSGGQRQRIGIARALALNPYFIVFDESVSALDVSVQAQVLNLLNDLKQEYNFTALFISHDLSVVHYISDRIMVMNKGKIVESGMADDVYYSPKEEYTQKLLASIPGKRTGRA
jgi:peptide/nickel transport system ATP-binding protein